MTVDAFIDALFEREGGYTDDPADRANQQGGATKFGLTPQTWGMYKRLGRKATRTEIKQITEAEAREFYRGVIAASPFASIAYEPLRLQMYDFAVNSGTARAVRWLQYLLRVPVSGVFDERTKAALNVFPAFLVNEALVGARMRMIVGAVEDWKKDKNPDEAKRAGINPKFEHGLLDRARSFSEIRV